MGINLPQMFKLAIRRLFLIIITLNYGATKRERLILS